MARDGRPGADQARNALLLEVDLHGQHRFIVVTVPVVEFQTQGQIFPQCESLLERDPPVVGIFANRIPKILLSTTYLRYPVGEDSDDWRGSFPPRFTFREKMAPRLGYKPSGRADNKER